MDTPKVKVEELSTPSLDETSQEIAPNGQTDDPHGQTENPRGQTSGSQGQTADSPRKARQRTSQHTIDEEMHETSLSAGVDFKEKQADIGEIYLKCIQTQLAKSVNKFPEFESWIDDFEGLLARKAVPLVNIGIIGRTGVGKSSLSNALFNEDIHHCSAMKAGTSYVTITSYNYDDHPNRKYRSRIETISAVEWLAELEILFSDLQDTAIGEKIETNTDAGRALAKIRALHPDISLEDLRDMSASQLLSIPDIQNMLGTEIEFTGSSWNKVKSQIRRFTNSRSTETGGHRKPAYWPLIKVQHNFLKREFLKHGCRIIDLPGVGDGNAARADIASQYMKNLDKTWVVWGIERGADDGSALELLDMSVKRRAQGCGKLDANHFTFIMTRSDQITVDNVMEELNLGRMASFKNNRKEQRQLTGRLFQLKRQKENLKNQCATAIKNYGLLDREIRNLRIIAKTARLSVDNSQATDASPISKPPGASKRKIEAYEEEQVTVKKSKSPESAEIVEKVKQRTGFARERKDLESKILQKSNAIELSQTEFEDSLLDLTAMCIQERNKWVINQVRTDFARELKQLEDDREEDGHGPSAESLFDENSVENLKVFTCSSTAYHQKRGRNQNQTYALGFHDVEETGIPSIREHTINCTIPARETVTQSFLTELNLINDKMKEWAEDNSPQTQISAAQRTKLENLFVLHAKNLKERVDELIESSVAEVNIARNKLESLLDVAAIKAEDEVPKLLDAWFVGTSTKKEEGAKKPVVEKKPVHHATFRAIAKRGGGPYVNSKKHKFNFNDEFVLKFSEKMSTQWGSLVTKTVPHIQKPLADDVSKLIGKFQTEFTMTVAETCPDVSVKLATKLSYLKRDGLELENAIRAQFKFLQDRACEIYDMPLKSVKRQMKDTYQRVAETTGRGSSHRNKDTMIENSNRTRHQMYEDAANDMKHALKEAHTRFETQLRLVFEKQVISRIRWRYEHVLNEAEKAKMSDALRLEKHQLQSTILKYIEELNGAWANGFNGKVDFANYTIPEKTVPVEEKPKSQMKPNGTDAGNSIHVDGEDLNDGYVAGDFDDADSDSSDADSDSDGADGDSHDADGDSDGADGYFDVDDDDEPYSMFMPSEDEDAI